jgi:CHAT domain-containing protein/tetratricopeptide (TPR) repeat protein
MSAQLAARKGTPGVEVLAVEPGSLGELAGLRPGDRLFGWRRAASFPANPLPAGGEIASTFDLQEILIDQAPRGALALLGRRAGEPRSWLLVAGPSADRTGLLAAPLLAEHGRALYRDGERALAAGDEAGALALWAVAEQEAWRAGEVETSLWLAARRPLALAAARRFEAADDAFATGVEALARAGRRRAAAELLEAWAQTLGRRTLWDRAIEMARRAQSVLGGSDAGALVWARALDAEAEMLRQPGRSQAAEGVHRAALRLRLAFAPDSLDVAQSYYGLGRTLFQEGLEGEAEELLARGAAMQERLDPQSLAQSRFLDAMGMVVTSRSDQARGEGLFRAAAELARRTEPRGYDAARALMHLGQTINRRGDYGAAVERLREALAIWSELPPDYLNRYNYAGTLTQLGWLYLMLGDAAIARSYLEQALDLYERLNPRAQGVAEVLDGLASLDLKRGDLAAAKRVIERSIALRSEITPDSGFLAHSLAVLGDVLLEEGKDLRRAEEVLERSRAISERREPGSIHLGDTLEYLAETELARRMPERAVESARKGLAIRKALALESAGEAMALNLLGRAERQAGQTAPARLHLCGAVDLFDRQRERLAGVDRARASFEATFSSSYLDCLSALLAAGRRGEAFAVLERARARVLLDLLAARDLALADAPAALEEERRRLRQEYDRLYGQLAALSAERDGPAVAELQRGLRDVRERQDGLVARVRAASPRIASLRYPVPLGLAAVRRALDPGTVLLSYAVGRESSFLFVVQAVGAGGAGVAVFGLPRGEAALRREVAAFRRLVASPTSDRRALRRQGRALYELLLRPAAPAIAASRRILIAPYGPLYSLPFAALVDARGHYLVERRPLHTVVSATVYAELRRSRRPAVDPRQRSVAAFGDPSYSALATAATTVAAGVRPADTPPQADERLRTFLARGPALTPLPATRREVEALGALFTPARLYLGAEATEERVKALGRDVRILHLATHALLDASSPLDSALVLSLPATAPAGGENGLLQAWEILEQVRLDADLVTLSACNTALGEEMGGEGLVGLTRAFQLAGARSVLASLWEVGDSATAVFMPAFYRRLSSGASKDEALRSAQRMAIRTPERSHPFFWAAFQLHGDYR